MVESPHKDDPYENTIFQTLASGGEDPTLEIGKTEDVDPDVTEVVDAGDMATIAVPPPAPGHTAGPTAGPTAGRTGEMPPSAPRITDTLAPAGSSDERTVPLARNRTIGNYRLDSQVGKGGQGEVWLGENVLAKRKVALKFLHASLANDEQAMADLTGEARVLFDLTHDRIVRLMNIEHGGGHAFLVMEFLGGPSVQDVFKVRRENGKRGLTTEECLWMLNEVAPALDYANAEGVTHRDIKPANMMLTEPVTDDQPLEESGARVKLCDFGIAFVANKSMAQKGEHNPIGTLPFMSPEVLTGEMPTPAADIYALGATLYYLVKGEPPIYGKVPPRELIKRIKSEIPAALQSGDAAFDAAIAKSLAKDPKERQLTADELLREASGGRMGRTAQKARTLRTALLSSVGVAILAVAAFFVYRASLAGVSAEFDLPAGLVTNLASLPVEIELPDPSVEQVVFAFVGGVPVKVDRRDALGFATHVPTPDRDGPAVLEVREPNGDRLYGTFEVIIDKTLDVEDVVRASSTAPTDVKAGVELTFEFDEPVRLEQRVSGAYVPLELNRSGNDLSGRIDLAGAAGMAADLADNQNWKLNFRATDDAGNAAPFEHVVRVYDEDAVVARYLERFPIGANETWHPWRLDGLVSQLDAWERDVAQDERIAEQRARVLDGDGRGELRARLRTVDESMPPAEIRVSAGGAHLVDADDELQLYTQQRSYLLQGVVENSRSEFVRVTEGVEQAKYDLDPADNRFQATLTLAPGSDRTLVLGAGDDERSVRVIQDDVEPTVELGELHPENANSFDLKINVKDANISRVWLESLSGEQVGEFALFEGVWIAEGIELPKEGDNHFTVHALDLAANQTDRSITVVRDTKGPTLTALREPKLIRAGELFEAVFEADEAISAAEATAYLVDRDGMRKKLGEYKDVVDRQLFVYTPVPDEDAARVELHTSGTDSHGNPSEPVVRQYEIYWDPMGHLPDEIEPLVERVPGDWPEYTLDGARRFPTCIRHVETGLEFVYVPSGTFRFGDENPENQEQAVVLEVEMSGFYIGRTEVSKAHFAAGLDQPVDDEAEAQLPQLVYELSEAATWCTGQGFRLPTEAQWEYAASGSANTAFPWGHGFQPQRVLAKLDATRAPAFVPVDSLAEGASWCHALHMAGNARELCRDVMNFERLQQGTLNPEGEPGTNHIFATRGGSRTASDDRFLRSDYHVVNEESGAGYSAKYGLRPVWELR